MHSSGINVGLFQPQNTSAAVTSKASVYSVPLNQILLISGLVPTESSLTFVEPTYSPADDPDIQYSELACHAVNFKITI